LASAALGTVLDNRTEEKDQQFHFDVAACNVSGKEYVSVKMIVVGFELISNKGAKDDFIRLTMDLRAGGQYAHKTVRWTGVTSDGGPYSVYDTVQVAFENSGNWRVDVKLIEYCVTTGRILWLAALSMIRIDQIVIEIEVIDEKTYKQIQNAQIGKETGTPEGG
jgi:hypothetical protein